MKKLNTVTISMVVFLISISFTLPKDRYQSKLEPGLYIISNDRGSEFQLNQTGKFYDVKENPIINIKHITSTVVGFTPWINGKKYPTLTFNLDSIGVYAISRIKDRIEIGLILNNKLRSVAEYTPFDTFEGSSIHIQGGKDDSVDEFNELKKDIDAAL
jgi:hypothetical protein